MIRQMAHICINTKDLDETGRFYFDALGLRKKFSFLKKKQDLFLDDQPVPKAWYKD